MDDIQLVADLTVRHPQKVGQQDHIPLASGSCARASARRLPVTTTGRPCMSKTCSSKKCLSHTAVCSSSKAVSSPRIFLIPEPVYSRWIYPAHSSKPWHRRRQTDSEYAAHRSLSFSHLPSQPQRRVIVLLPFAGVIMETAIWQPRSEKNFIKGPAILRSPE